MKEVYLDNAATTKVDENVAEVMKEYLIKEYGNASSQHSKGQEAKRALEQARDVIAKSIGAKGKEIYFTSGGTESNNWTLKGLWFAAKQEGNGKNHIITTKIEHDCVLNSCRWLEKQGARITYLDVDEEGFVDITQLSKEINDKTIVVSIIHGNNEIGTIQDLKKISEICKKHNVLLHSDACQSYTKTEIKVDKLGIDLLTLNAHKIHGPKGVGALYIREGIKIEVLMHGGGHERNMRSGTENIPGIVGFAKAVKNANNQDVKRMSELRDYCIKEILKIQGVKLNGSSGKDRLCNNINICFGNIEGEAIGGYLEAYGICTSTGSACSSHSLQPSHVLTAIGRTNLEANTSIRISLSKETTKQEMDHLLNVLPKIVEKLRKISPYKLHL